MFFYGLTLFYFENVHYLIKSKNITTKKLNVYKNVN